MSGTLSRMGRTEVEALEAGFGQLTDDAIEKFIGSNEPMTSDGSIYDPSTSAG